MDNYFYYNNEPEKIGNDRELLVENFSSHIDEEVIDEEYNESESPSESEESPAAAEVEPEPATEDTTDKAIKYSSLTKLEKNFIDKVVGDVYISFILFNYFTTKFDIKEYRVSPTRTKNEITYLVVVMTKDIFGKEKNELLTIKVYLEESSKINIIGTKLEKPNDMTFTSGVAGGVYFIVFMILLIMLLSM